MGAEQPGHLQGRFEIDGSLITEKLSLHFYDDEQTIALDDANRTIPGSPGPTLFLHPLSSSNWWHNGGRQERLSQGWGRYLEPFSPRQFQVAFELPRNEMKQFFGIDDRHFNNVEEILDRL